MNVSTATFNVGTDAGRSQCLQTGPECTIMLMKMDAMHAGGSCGVQPRCRTFGVHQLGTTMQPRNQPDRCGRSCLSYTVKCMDDPALLRRKIRPNSARIVYERVSV